MTRKEKQYILARVRDCLDNKVNLTLHRPELLLFKKTLMADLQVCRGLGKEIKK